MLHFAGKKGRVRLNLVDYYYPRAKKVRKCWCPFSLAKVFTRKPLSPETV